MTAPGLSANSRSRFLLGEGGREAVRPGLEVIGERAFGGTILSVGGGTSPLTFPGRYRPLKVVVARKVGRSGL